MYRFKSICVTVCATAILSGAVQAQAPQQGTSGRSAARTAVTPAVLPGTSERALTGIQGNALNATSGPLPNTVVRLRDARYGGIIDRQLTDRSGLFEFSPIDPGSYVVELLGSDEKVLAASELLNANAGETVSAVVRLPFPVSLLEGVLGHSTAQAVSVISAASSQPKSPPTR